MVKERALTALLTVLLMVVAAAPAAAERPLAKGDRQTKPLAGTIIGERADAIIGADGLIYGIEGQTAGKVVGYVEEGTATAPTGASVCRCNGIATAPVCKGGSDDCAVFTICAPPSGRCFWYISHV